MSRTLPHPASPEAPKYWANEQGDKLRPAMIRYLSGNRLSIPDLEILGAYLRQWVDSPVWNSPEAGVDYELSLGALRRETHGIRTAQDLDLCVEAMIELGMDPL